MNPQRLVSLLLVYFYPSVGAYALDHLNGVLHNPFHKPYVIDPAPVAKQSSSDNEDTEPVLKPNLSMTLRAGKQSSANIGGKIIKLGEKINGYELIDVQERSVTLVKKGQVIHLNLDEPHEK